MRATEHVNIRFEQPHRNRGQLLVLWITSIFILLLNTQGLSALPQQIGQVRGTVVAVTADQKQRLPGIKVILTNLTTQRTFRLSFRFLKF